MAAAAALIAEESNLKHGMDLLGEEPAEGENDIFDIHDRSLVTSPILTGDVLATLGRDVFPQTALYGRVLSQHGDDLPRKPQDIRLFINSNTPSSGLVCGVQGSGKSHTTAVLLEGILIQNPRLGTLPQPLSALVFHFDTAAGGSAVQPCEAAYLASPHPTRGAGIVPPSVTVLVLPNNLHAMRRVYAGLPSVQVEPLHFAPGDISGERLLSMMIVDEDTQIPLYMEAVMAILRSMEGSFDYATFRDALQKQTLNDNHNAMLNLRLALFDSCLNEGTPESSVVTHFREGHLTIIDLSSPLMDGSSACVFFDIILGLFVEANINATGKLVVFDEAHNYLSKTRSSSRLTESLLTVVRQQRHLATRVVISTQEPTVVPAKFLELSSYIVAHRLSSPNWLQHLSHHTSPTGGSIDTLFRKIMSLGTGEAILFSPNGLAARIQKADYQTSSRLVPTRIGQGYLIVRSRLRVTRDGGHSILAVHNPALSSPLSRPSGDADEPSAPPVVRLPSSISSHPGSVNVHCSHPRIDNISDADDTPDPDRFQAAETVEEGSNSLRAPSRLPALPKQKWKTVDEQCEPPSSVREEQISVDEQIAIALQHVDEEAEQIAGHDTWRGDICSELHRATLVSPSLASATLSPPIPANTGAFTGSVADTGRVSASTGHLVLSDLHSHLVRIVTRERVCDWTELWWLQKKYKDEFGKQNLRRFIQGCVDDGLVRRVDDTHIALPDTSRQVISDTFSGPSHTPASPLAAEPSNVGAASSQREPVIPVGPEPLAVAGNGIPSIGGSALEPRPAQASVSDCDVESLVVLLQTHAAEGFPELGVHYVMGQTRGYGVSGSSMEARMKVAIARAEALGLIGVRHTALGEWLHLPGAILDNIPTSHTYSAASDSAWASWTSCERHEPAPTPAKVAESANVAAKGKETPNAGVGTSPGADSATSQIIAMALADETLALLNASRVASGSTAPAHTSPVQGAVKPEPDVPTCIGQDYLTVRSRLRVTQDGGHTLLAAHNPPLSSRLSRPLGDPPGPAAPPVVEPTSSISFKAGLVAVHTSQPHLYDLPDATETPAPHPPAASVQDESSSSQEPRRLPTFIKQKWKAFDQENVSLVSADEQVTIALQHADDEGEQSAEAATPRDATLSDAHRTAPIPHTLQDASPSIQLDISACIGPVADAVQAAASAGLPISKSAFSHLVRIVTRESISDWTKFRWLVKKHNDELGHSNLQRFIQACVDGGLVRRVDETHITLPDTSQLPASDPVSCASHTSALRFTATKDATSKAEPDDDNPFLTMRTVAVERDTDVLVAFLNHQWSAGCSRLGSTYVKAQLSTSWNNARMKACVGVALSRRLLHVEKNKCGEWLFPPGTQAPRVLEDPARLPADEFAPLLAFLRSDQKVGIKIVRSYFCFEYPECPYGTKPAIFISVLKRAHALGLIAHEGTAWDKIWLAHPSPSPESRVTPSVPCATVLASATDVEPYSAGSPSSDHVLMSPVHPEPSTEASDDVPSISASATAETPARPSIHHAAPMDDSDVQSLLLFLQTHATAGFPEVGLEYVMGQRLGYGTGGPSMKLRIRFAIARAETFGLIGVRRTALGKWLYLQGARGDDVSTHEDADADAAPTLPAQAFIEPQSGALNVTAAGTTLAPAGVEPEDVGSDGDSDDISVGVTVSEADVESLVALCQHEFAVGNVQLGLTYVRTKLRPAKQRKQWKLARLRPTVSTAMGRGLVSVHATPFGEWLLAPGTVPRVFVDPSDLEAADFEPLLAYLRDEQLHPVHAARTYFFKETARCQYGTRPAAFSSVLQRASALGLIRNEGIGWGNRGFIRRTFPSRNPAHLANVVIDLPSPAPRMSAEPEACGGVAYDYASGDESEPAAAPGASAVPVDEADIQNLLALLRRDAAAGCHYLGVTYVVTQLAPIDGKRRVQEAARARLRSAMLHAEALGHIDVCHTELGEWLHLPGAPAPAPPSSAAEMQAEHLQMLVDFVRTGTDASPRTMKQVRNDFKKMPSAPLGTGAKPFRLVVERAAELGLVVPRGKGYGKTGWLRPAQRERR